MTWLEPPRPAETQVMVASTVFGLATLAAALEDSLFPAASRRILVLSVNAATPETAPPLAGVAGFDQLVKRFDAVYSYNEAVAPQHPAEWMPRSLDLDIWDRHFRQLWDLDSAEHLRLVVESIHVRPAAALCAILHEAEIEVYADGLMSYGPTRNAVPPQVATRVTRLLHLDLVPGLQPLLLSEWQVPATLISTAGFRSVLGEISAHADVPPQPEPVAVLLGQYLSALGILTPVEETELHREMLRTVVALGHRRVVFKPHPSASDELFGPMADEAAAAGVDVLVWRESALAETLFERLPVALVVGCFSTALLTATSCYGLPAARVGTELLLERLRPYHNSNRVPVTVVDALLPALVAGRLEEQHAVPRERLGELVTAVGYAMQPQRYPWMRAPAQEFLAASYPAVARYFKRKRLTQLGLPGALPAVVKRAPAPRPWRSLRRRFRRRAHQN